MVKMKGKKEGRGKKRRGVEREGKKEGREEKKGRGGEREE